MSTQRVKHGQTFSLTGTLGANGTLVGLSGGPGALIEVLGYAENKGDIQLNGARAPHKQGATLSDTGTFTNAGTLSVGGGYDSTHGALLDIEGTLTNTGVLVAEAGQYDAGSQIRGAGGQIHIGGSGLMRNSGVLTLATTSFGSYGLSQPGGTLLDSGRLVNEARGVIDVTGSFRGALMTVSGSFDNLGTLNIDSGFYSYYGSGTAGTVAVSGFLHNSGYILVGRDNYLFGGALLSISGSLDNVGTIFVTGLYQADLPGNRGQTLEIAGVLTNRGQITLQSGGSSHNYPGVGALLLDNGTVENSGTLTVEGNVGAVTTSATVVVNGVFSNTGTILQQQDSRIVVNGNTGYLVNDGAITIAGGVGTAAGELAVAQGGLLRLNTGTIQGGGVLLNQGAIVEGGGFSVISGVSFINDGTVDIFNNSLLTIDSAVTSDPGKAGALIIASGSILDLNGPVAASERVSFFQYGYRNLLELGNAATFSGTLAVGATDTIDFLKQDITSASTAGYTIALGVAGGATIDLALATPLRGVSLSLQSDGNGGTDLLFGVAPGH